MKLIHKYCSTVVGLALLALQPVLAQLPKRDLTIELRQVEDAETTGYSVSTNFKSSVLAPQSVQVRNGEKASLSIGKTMTMQWVKSVNAQSASLSASGATASSSAGGVSHAMTTMKSGTTIKVHPNWTGKIEAVTVEVEVESDTVEARNGAELPNQAHSQVATTVSAALGQWVTIASSGAGPSQQAGVYSSSGRSEPRRLLQIRVSAP
jgi:hypothetical protein